MQAIMKAEKMRPWSRCSPLGLRAGVHRNTNVYMLVSNSDCIAPSSAILGSACNAQHHTSQPRRARCLALEHVLNWKETHLDLLCANRTRVLKHGDSTRIVVHSGVTLD